MPMYLKRYSFKRSLLAGLLIILSAFPAVFSQMPQYGSDQPAVTGWIDDNHYYFRTRDAENKTVLYTVDARSGKQVPVTAPKSEREMLTESLPAGIQAGMTDLFNSVSKSLVINRENDLFLFREGFTALKRLTDNSDAEANPRFSPDGKRIAYTRNKDLYVYDLELMKETRLTFDASDRIYNGYAAWVYYEEILGRASRYAAFWWSPAGDRIAFLRFDETDVPVFTLNRLDEPDGVHGKLEVVPYPKAGDPNPKVKMGIVNISNLNTTWVKTDYSVDQYLAWPFWTPDGKMLAVQVLNRDQTDLKIILADAETGDYSQIYSEQRPTWVEFREDVYVFENGSGFLIRSYRNGWENLYYHSWDGSLKATITGFDFRVTSIDRVDEKAGYVYFSATGTESTDQHQFRVRLDGKELLQISKEPGTHNVNISPLGTWFVDSWSSVTNPGKIVLYDKKGKVKRNIYSSDPPSDDHKERAVAELVKIKTSDGLFDMPAIITYPLNFDPALKYPVVFTIYGGPDSKNVNNRWAGNTESWYARNGIITISVDHRGSGHFGKNGLDYMHRSLGKWELLDYADAVKWLIEKPFVDKNKIGMTGTSYGGYLTSLALTRGADYWTHGVSGMPVTDYRLYDNVYTERYMDTPQDNPAGYKDGSALTYAGNLKGELFIYHADMDDNVHMQNSIYLISRLQDEGKRFRFMLYPNGRHGWGGSKALHVRSETWNFWLEEFFGKETK